MEKTKSTSAAKTRNVNAKSSTSKTLKKKKTPTLKAETTQKVDNETREKTTQQVIVNRELKYKYPADVIDTLSRKSWRQKVRGKLNRMELNLAKATDAKTKSKIEAQLKAYEKEVLA